MRRSTRLLVVGLFLLTVAFVLPFADFATADWDRDYRYRTPDDGFCADAVADVAAGGAPQTADFVVTRESLSQAALADVRRAETRGSYTVENESDADGPFVFATDHQARGLGCYAIHDADTGVYRALVTAAVTHRSDTLQRRAVDLGSRVAVALGALSVLSGTALALRRRLP